jgi:hypothetical protein
MLEKLKKMGAGKYLFDNVKIHVRVVNGNLIGIFIVL